MSELITEKTLEEYEAFVQSCPKGNFAQSVLWAKQKPMWTWKAIATRGKDGSIKGTLAVLIRKVPATPFTLMYGCRGPVCDPADHDTIKDLLQGAKQLAKQYKSYVIKLDPDIPSSNEQFRNFMLGQGFRLKEGGKNFEAIQPRYVFRLNVEGKTEEEVMAGFHQKWRYNIRVAQRKGVEVKICGKEMGAGLRPHHAGNPASGRLRDPAAGILCPDAGQPGANTAACIWLSMRASHCRYAGHPLRRTRCGICTERPPTSTGT